MLHTPISHPFRKLILIYVFWLISWILAGSLFEVYFFGLGLTIHEIIGAGAFWFVGSLLVTPFFRSLPARAFMLGGIAIAFVSVFLLAVFPDPNMAYVYRFLLGFTNFFFWVPFNILFYEFRKENNAQLAALYYAVGPALMLLLPGISGLIASEFGYVQLYLLAMASYAVAFVLAFFFLGKESTYGYSFEESIASIRGLKFLIFLEGFLGSVIISIMVEAMLLQYVDMPLDFGVFISLSTAFSLFASFITARISDIKRRRREYLLFSAFLFGISAIFTGTNATLEHFFLGVALISFFKTILFPISFALVVDNSKNLVTSMVGREFILNLGRALGTIFVFALLFLFDLNFILVLQGIGLLLVYPSLFEIKKRKLAII